MNKQDLIEKVASVIGGTKADAERAVECVFDSVRDAVKAGDKVSLGGFGIFEKRTRKGRVGRNPRTGDSVTIPDTNVIKFRPAKPFKDEVK